MASVATPLNPTSLSSSSSLARPLSLETTRLPLVSSALSRSSSRSLSREMKKKLCCDHVIRRSLKGGPSVVASASAASAPAADVAPLSVGDDLPSDYTSDDPYKTNLPRRAGILLHPTSLPGSYGIGDLGDGAIAFLDWLSSTGCTIWQVLPLVPPGRKSGEDGSPYAGQDANCGNILLLSLEELVKDGLLEPEDLPEISITVDRIDFEKVAEIKDPLILKAAKNLVNSSSGPLKEELEEFRASPSISIWLEEAALFSALDDEQQAQFWWEWPADLRDRSPDALASARARHRDYIDSFVAQQFLFQRQWQKVHAHAASLGICIVGDMPIYVGGHSADVWANRSQFELDPDTGIPTLVSGVPPDLFSATGQLWGSPLYNWQKMAEDRYQWWGNRMKRAFDLYDEFRVDHFRGFAGYWAIPADSETAINGKWKLGPREAFFDAIKSAVGKIDIIAEDLGVITSDVVALRRAIDAPGMAVLQFAFGSNSRNPHLPHNHEINQVVYPGTHDNETVVGWWSRIEEKEKTNVIKYLQCEDTEEIHWDFIRSAVSSVARTAIFAMQDIMGLDNSARMNTPAVQKGNWGWRVGDIDVFDQLKDDAARLRQLLADFNRISRK